MIPALLLKEKRLKEKLEKEIFGQSMAINSVVDIVKNKMIFTDSEPRYTFFLLGTPTTGKKPSTDLFNLGRRAFAADGSD